MKTRFVLAAAIIALAPIVTSAAPVTPGNLVIYRVGTGSGAIGTTATAVFLDEYTTAGALVQSITVPASGGGAMTAVGNATTEGIISRSQDGTTLIFTGYRKTAGGTSPASDTYLVTPRVVGTLTVAGTPDTTTTISNDNGATTANTIRSATAVNGTSGSPLWISTSTRVSYDASGIGSTAGTTQIDARNSRQVNLNNNTLYASNGSTAITGKVQTYGTLPTGATAATPIVALTTADAVNGFFLADLSAGVPGGDTLYALSTVAGQLLKYTFNGSSWLANGSVASSASNLVGIRNGSSVDLYLTSGTTLSKLTDASGYGANITGTITSLATATTNTAFRGIGTFDVTVAIPEAGGFVLASLVSSAVGMVAVWRKRVARTTNSVA